MTIGQGKIVEREERSRRIAQLTTIGERLFLAREVREAVEEHIGVVVVGRSAGGPQARCRHHELRAQIADLVDRAVAEALRSCADHEHATCYLDNGSARRVRLQCVHALAVRDGDIAAERIGEVLGRVRAYDPESQLVQRVVGEGDRLAAPIDDFHQIAIENLGQFGIDNRTVRVVKQVG